MDESLLHIFSTYYKRIMRIESILKSNLIDKYTFFYKNNVFRNTYNIFSQKQKEADIKKI